jgi:dynein heavy chain
VVEASKQTSKKYEDIFHELCNKIENIEELTTMEEYMEEVPSKVKELKVEADSMLAEYQHLADLRYFLPRSEFNCQWKLFGYPKMLADKIDALVETNAVTKEEYLDTMKEEQQLFEENLRSLDAEVNNLSRFTQPERVDQTATYVRKIKDKLEKYKQEAQLFNSREGLFENDITEYTQLSSISRNFEPYAFLWETADAWKKIMHSGCMASSPILMLKILTRR